MTRIVLFWSGGKDSALALEALRLRGNCTVAALLTTFTRAYDRISMHGVRRELALAQADAAGVPLIEAWIDRGANNADYEAAIDATLAPLRGCGVTTAAFGDLFLADIRAYRVRLMQRLGFRSCFPLWGRDTRRLARQFLAAGFLARLCCVDTRHVPAEFAGCEYDQHLLETLPAGVDPCGENGEFHSFVCGGPIFRRVLAVARGELRHDGPFTFCDLVPATIPQEACT